MASFNQNETNNLSVRYLLQLCTIVFLSYLVLGISFGTLPDFIIQTLHYNSLTVGIALGVQSAATLVTRHCSGTLCDTKGSKRSAMTGLIFFIATGIFYMLACAATEQPGFSISLLLIARILLGLGESFLVTGVLSWGIGLTGISRSGKVMAWNGIAMYGGMAFGAPLGIVLQHRLSLNGAFASVIFLAIAAFAIAYRLKATMPSGAVRIPFYTVVKSIWRQGAGLALSAVGFSVIASFIMLYYTGQHWQNASLALTVFGLAYILARIPFAHFPDKYGGRKIALFSLSIQTTGLLFLWLAVSQSMAFIAVALVGAGFSMVFPSLGVEAVKQVSSQNRGAALGAYAAFFDLAIGITNPVAGFAADKFGYAAIYLLAAITSFVAVLLTYCNTGRNKN